MSRPRVWPWLIPWVIAGALLALGLMVFGVLVVPVAFGAGLIVRVPAWRRGRAMFGLLAGAGAAVTWVGSLNLDYRACSSHHQVTLMLPAGGGRRSASYSCGGIDGKVWMIVGISIIAASLLLFVWRSLPPRHRGTPRGLAAHPQ